MAASVCSICGQRSFLCSDLQSSVRSVSEVRQAFKDYGLTVTDWAERHGVHKASVFQVLYKKHRSYHGNAHAIAVLLRLKNGDISEFITSRKSAAQIDNCTVVPPAQGEN